MNYENDFRYNFDFSFSSNNDDHVNVSFKAVGVTQIITKFQDFLTGCGFVLDGDLQIVARDTHAAQYKSQAYQGTFNSLPASGGLGSFNSFPTSGGISKDQFAALTPTPLQSFDLSSFDTQSIRALKPEDIKLQYPNKNEDILHFGV